MKEVLLPGKSTFLFAKKCTSLFAKICTFLFAKKCTSKLLKTVHSNLRKNVHRYLPFTVVICGRNCDNCNYCHLFCPMPVYSEAEIHPYQYRICFTVKNFRCPYVEISLFAGDVTPFITQADMQIVDHLAFNLKAKTVRFPDGRGEGFDGGTGLGAKEGVVGAFHGVVVEDI